MVGSLGPRSGVIESGRNNNVPLTCYRSITLCVAAVEYEEGSDEESGKDWDELEQEAAKGTALVCP